MIRHLDGSPVWRFGHSPLVIDARKARAADSLGSPYDGVEIRLGVFNSDRCTGAEIDQFAQEWREFRGKMSYAENIDGWRYLGILYYLDADDREGPTAHDGRGVLTYFGKDGKESWASPEDDLRMVFSDGHWQIYVLVGSETAQEIAEGQN